MSKIKVKLVTPVKILFDDEADMIIMRTREGDIGVLHGHTALTTSLGYGVLKVFNEGQETQLFAVLGGFAEINGEGVTILSDAAERPQDIDRERAEEAKARAERDMAEKSDNSDIARAQYALRRALVRLEISTYNLTQNK